MKPSFIVHGGAGNFPDEALGDCRAGIQRALETGWKILSCGGAAIEAVTAAIVILENDPVFDAGIGSHLNRDGRVQTDAILMEGSSLKAGSVAAVERVRNPILLARLVLERSEHMMLAAAGAEQFAKENGLLLCDPEDLITDHEREAWHRCLERKTRSAHLPLAPEGGTVGAVAIDVKGDLVAGTSTGGTCCKYPGRVGDSPLIGCGCYADVQAGGVSCTGQGEGIMKIVMAKMAVDLLAHWETIAEHRDDKDQDALRGAREETTSAYRSIAQEVADSAIARLAARAHSTGGLILLDARGCPAVAFNTPRMAYGYVEETGLFQIAP